MNRSELISHYYPMVREVASRISQRLPSHIDVEDLVHVGMIGLIDAIDRLIDSSPSSLPAYLKIRVQGSILDELRRNDWIPRSVRDRHQRLKQTQQLLQERLGRSPSDSEMAIALNISLQRYDKLKSLSAVSTVLSLDDQGDNNFSLGDIIPSREQSVLDQISHSEDQQIIKEALQMLSERDHQIIELYYYKEYTFREISMILGVTEARISQLHSQIRSKLKHNPKLKSLNDP